MLRNRQLFIYSPLYAIYKPMKMKRILIICLIFTQIATELYAQKSDTLRVNNDKIIFSQNDSVNAFLSASFLLYGKEKIEIFFEHPYKNNITVYLFDSRNSLDEAFQNEWNMPNFKTQCWMVASGISDKLYILSPLIWQKEACEHNPNDLNKTRKLFIHELVHSYHAQYNSNKNMEGFSEMSWFVEGLAVFVSGQLTKEKEERLKLLKSDNALPDQLSKFWKGQNRYVVSGSIVKFITEKYGNEKIFECLKFQNTQEILSYLGITESELIFEWKKSI